MTRPEQSGGSFGFPEPSTDAFHESPTDIDREKTQRVLGAINALRTNLTNGGWLSTLAWNTRNAYLASPQEGFPAEHMQMIVEGFLTEIESLKARIPNAEPAREPDR